MASVRPPIALALALTLGGGAAVAGATPLHLAAAPGDATPGPVETPAASDDATTLDTNVDASQLAGQVADAYVTIFQKVVIADTTGHYAVDMDAAQRLVPDAPVEALQQIADGLNGKPMDSVVLKSAPTKGSAGSEDWKSFGKCVITGVLGFSPFQLDYNKLGQYISERAWNKVADILKRYAEKEIAKKAESVALKQIVKATPAGFAAWLGVYTVGCGIKEAIDW